MVKKLILSMIICVVTFITITSSAFADYYSQGTLLRYGMNNSEVTNLQNDLKKLGYLTYNSTGYFGSLTKSSVIKFQRDNNLLADGIVGHNTAREIKVEKVINLAKKLRGVPYVWGGVSPQGFDCSGFTHYVFLQNNITIQRSASSQYSEGSWVDKNKLKPGDLVFFSTYKPGPSHVGIYIGNNQMIHASSGSGCITTADLGNSYFSQHYLGAKRIIW